MLSCLSGLQYTFSPKKGDFHDLSMNALSKFCKHLLELYNGGDKKKINMLANYHWLVLTLPKRQKAVGIITLKI